MDIKKKADLLSRKHQSRNPFEIIKGLNAILVFAPLIGVRGFYQYFQRNNIIYVDEDLPYHEKMFVCAHELGHMLLHKKSNAVFMDSRTFLNTSFYEKEANTFAVNLLIDNDMLYEHRDLTIEQLSRLWGYDKELIELRLK
ncbi:ImmA/IrrE family metallo-endopeptidase [Lacrimispora sp.]|uniref:ImmA/IrrE family metallo-endopeptidase n=1 Tax=Lacrimispora sp. TaxID=2719234 RepID=UPI0028B1E8C0|nr:ImmA/IrrE family metallo-endopeptidase [Lacrimispora sp.]